MYNNPTTFRQSQYITIAVAAAPYTPRRCESFSSNDQRRARDVFSAETHVYIYVL